MINAVLSVLLLVLSGATALETDLNVGDYFPRIELLHPQDNCFSEVPVLIEYNVTGFNPYAIPKSRNKSSALCRDYNNHFMNNVYLRPHS
jgi:hypothetical protein